MTKLVTVHYRRLVDRHFGDFDLRAPFEQSLDAVVGGVRLGDHDTARRTTSSEGRAMQLLAPQIDPNFCFGELVIYKEGDVPVAATNAAGQVTLGTIPLDENEEAVRGTTWFMAKGPHVALVNQDSSVRFTQEFLNWFLRAPIGPVPQDEFLTFQPYIHVGGQPVLVREVKSLKIRAEVEDAGPAVVQAADDAAAMPRSFRKLIERQPLSPANMRSIFRAIGLTPESLEGLQEHELRDLEIELLVRRRQDNRITTLPEELIQGVFDDGLERAAELQKPGQRRRGDAIVLTYSGNVGMDGPYYAQQDVRALLWEAFGSWEEQELI